MSISFFISFFNPFRTGGDAARALAGTGAGRAASGRGERSRQNLFFCLLASVRKETALCQTHLAAEIVFFFHGLLFSAAASLPGRYLVAGPRLARRRSGGAGGRGGAGAPPVTD